MCDVEYEVLPQKCYSFIHFFGIYKIKNKLHIEFSNQNFMNPMDAYIGNSFSRVIAFCVSVKSVEFQVISLIIIIIIITKQVIISFQSSIWQLICCCRLRIQSDATTSNVAAATHLFMCENFATTRVNRYRFFLSVTVTRYTILCRWNGVKCIFIPNSIVYLCRIHLASLFSTSCSTCACMTVCLPAYVSVEDYL